MTKRIDDMTYDERLERLEMLVEKIFLGIKRHTEAELRIVRGELKNIRIEEMKRRAKPRRASARHSRS